MFCTKCGSQLSDNSMFCAVCGNQHNHAVPAIHTPPVYTDNINASGASPRKSKAPLIAILVCCFVLICATGVLVFGNFFADDGEILPEVQITGFDTPEDALIAYLEGLRDSDLEQMLSAFAIETFVENYDFEALLNRIRAYSPHGDLNMPNANAFAVAMNIERRRARIVDTIIFQYISISGFEVDMSRMEILEDEQAASNFARRFERSLNAPGLETIEIIGFIRPEDLHDLYLSEVNQGNIARNAEVFGADRLESRVAVFELDRSRYMLFVNVVNYDDRWYIESLGGNIGNLLGIAAFHFGIVPFEDFGHFHEINLERVLIPVESQN